LEINQGYTTMHGQPIIKMFHYFTTDSSLHMMNNIVISANNIVKHFLSGGDT